MKTPEDEAFDELAKRQGDWGGGYQAKRAMAADKQRPWVGLTDEEIAEIRLKSFDSIATNRKVYEAIEAKLKEKNNG
jgi:hypothetical protein